MKFTLRVNLHFTQSFYDAGKKKNITILNSEGLRRKNKWIQKGHEKSSSFRDPVKRHSYHSGHDQTVICTYGGEQKGISDKWLFQVSLELLWNVSLFFHLNTDISDLGIHLKQINEPMPVKA